jgi:hypothetical protein
MRWFSDLPPETRLYGVDIYKPAIDWCRMNCKVGEFQHTEPLPPLPFADQSMDLIYGVSVLTHLDEDFQDAWLEELGRLVAPGGIVMLTVHGEDAARMALPIERLAKFESSGFFFEKATDASVEGLPDFYQVAYHSRRYIEDRWSHGFRVLLYVQHGPMYRQELVVLERIETEPPAVKTENRNIALPMACLDIPKVNGLCAPGDALEVSGWAFGSEHASLKLSLVLDGVAIGSCMVNQCRLDVAQVFSNNPNARNSGFASRLLTEDWSPGLHTLWIECDNSPIPLAATYLRVAK